MIFYPHRMQERTTRSALTSPLNKSIYDCQKRLQGLCWGLLQRIWWPSETLDHVQWALDLLLKWVCVWHVCAGPVLTMGAGKVQRWGFRNRTLHCLSSSDTRPCRNSPVVQGKISGQWWTHPSSFSSSMNNNSIETMQFWVSVHQWPNAECRWSKKEILE